MTWKACSEMESKTLFLAAAGRPGANIRAVCREFGISPTTGYRLITREREQGRTRAITGQSRRPHTSPHSTPPAIEAAVVAAKERHPSFGARKLRTWLQRFGDVPAPPAASTIQAILRRHGLVAPPPLPAAPVQSFVRPEPNDLWQMDFLGHHPTGEGRVHPLTVLDDHSRYGLCLTMCAHERGDLVLERLVTCFRDVGLPREILTDNGPPWGMRGHRGCSFLEVQIIKYGITVIHGRILHPQTQGKIERWHETINDAVFHRQSFATLADAQAAGDHFRTTYNQERPHEALEYQVPADRYRPSPRRCPDVVPPVVYDAGDIVRKVSAKGTMSFANRLVYVGEGLRGEPVAVRPTDIDGVFEIVFGHQRIMRLNLHEAT